MIHLPVMHLIETYGLLSSSEIVTVVVSGLVLGAVVIVLLALLPGLTIWPPD